MPPAAAYACEIWAFQRFSQAFSTSKLDLATSHLQLLKEITGVRGSTSTDILLAELGLKSPQHVWLLRAAKFWNNLAGKPHGSIYGTIALDGCLAAVGSSRRNWAWSMFKAIRATGYELSIRADAMDIIDITALKQHIVRQRDSIWDGLDICPRTCPSKLSRCCTYARWFARPVGMHARSLLDIPVSAACMKGLLRFRMGCHRLPRGGGMKGHGLGPRSLDWTEYAVFVQQVCWGMRNILFLSAQSCSALGYSGPISFRAHKQCKDSCGRPTKLGLPNLSMLVCKR